MYVARKFVASAIDDIAVNFQCNHCGHRALAEVIAVGHGSSEAPFLLGQDLARNAAASEASRALPRAAILAAGLSGCPRCDKPSSTALRDAWIAATLAGLASWMGVLALVAALLAGTVVHAVSGPLAIAGVVVPFLLVLFLLARRQLARLVRDSKARVTWRELA